jgi:hypothetical protein
LTFAAILSVCVPALALVGCGGGDDDDDDGKPAGGGGGGGNAGSTPASGNGGGQPMGGDLPILFSPMYSGYDGKNTYQVPAIVSGVSDVKWKAEPEDAVDIDPDAMSGGVIITTRKAGDVKITATAGPLSGSSMLHITQFTPEERAAGEMRYNNMIPLPEFMFDRDAGMPRPQDIVIPDDLSCANCHGSGAAALDVEHTPQQTGGYSDDALIAIITMGMKPPGSMFHTPVPPFLYQMFHTWGASDAEKRGLVAYLRSLAPKSQGPLDFAGLINRGRMMGGTAGAGAAGAGAAGTPAP